MANDILPWHQHQWSHLLQHYQQDRLPHALLFCGPLGMGKYTFAQQLAHALLCQQPIIHNNHIAACGHCKPCHLLTANNHPDLKIVTPAEVGKQIKIEQIRDLIEFCNLTPNYERYQIVIISPAEAMNRNAANSLLKLLEEPPSKTLIFSISHQPMALMATIRSRCQRINFSHPDKQSVTNWLKNQFDKPQDISLLLNLSAQAPLAALALVKNEDLAKRHTLLTSLTKLILQRENPVQTAEIWHKLDSEKVLSWMLSWTMDLIRYSMTQHMQHVINHDFKEQIQQIANKITLTNLFQLLDLQKESYRLLVGTTANVKPQGILESLAIEWSQRNQSIRKT